MLQTYQSYNPKQAQSATAASYSHARKHNQSSMLDPLGSNLDKEDLLDLVNKNLMFQIAVKKINNQMQQ